MAPRDFVLYISVKQNSAVCDLFPLYRVPFGGVIFVSRTTYDFVTVFCST